MRHATRSASSPLVLLLAVIFLLTPIWAWCQELAIGTPAFAQRVNIFNEDDWASYIVRLATTQSLVRSNGVRFELDLSDRLTVNDSGTEWRFRIPRGVRFSDGESVGIADVLSSLQRCEKITTGWTVAKLAATAPDAAGWVMLTNERATAVQSRELPHRLAGCPVLDAESSRTFGSELGYGSSFLGSGPFLVKSFGNGRSILLERSPNRLAGVAASATLTVRSLASPEQGLVALRSGTLDILFAPSEDVLSRASEDGTLAVSECWGERVLHRQGLQFSCSDLAFVRYVG